MTVILKLRIDGEQVATLHADQLPCEIVPQVRVDGPVTVEFEDAAGRVHAHSLPAATGWLHLSVRVHAGFGCQADAVIVHTETHAAGAPLGEGEVGVRFQPFFLAGAANVPDLAGHGLFARGLHFRGIVTPGTVLLSCACDACHRTFLVRSIHAGFAEQAYFYSASGTYTLLVDGRVAGAPVPLAPPDPVLLATLETALPPAPDGTRFAYLNPFRCPHCRASYLDFAANPGEREGEYYALHFPDTPPMHMPDAPLADRRDTGGSLLNRIGRLFN
ncbi:hypothetical protein [Sphingomonas montana]|uniref:hypothetical protein n=1 Tax=Sphingomonas montana TaxID=1843236 RepID=UPI00096F19B6|nr:hypothetical protein [Sphingomonas montana]